MEDTVCCLRSRRDLVTNRTPCSFPCFPFETKKRTKKKSTETVCCDRRITIGGCPILNSFLLRSRTDTFKISTSFRQYYPSFHTNVLCFDWYRSPFAIIPMWCIFLVMYKINIEHHTYINRRCNNCYSSDDFEIRTCQPLWMLSHQIFGE